VNVFQRIAQAIFQPNQPQQTQPAKPQIRQGRASSWRFDGQAQGLSTIGQGSNAYFEALRSNGDRTPVSINAFGDSYKYGATGPERKLLSALSRAMYENGGYVGYAVNQIAAYCAPIRPQADTASLEWNNAAEAWWANWCKRCDFLGRNEITFDGLQTMISQAIDLDGDMGVTITDEGGIPQIQLIEGWRIDSPRQLTKEENVHDGIKLDSKGRVQGYYVEAGNKSDFIDANRFFLARDPSVVSPYRGLSSLRRGMNDMRDARDILGFEKLAVKHNAGMIGVLEGGYLDESAGFDLSGSGETGDADAPEGNPLSDASPGEKQLSRNDILGGDIPVLPEGKTFKRVESNRPNAQFDSFLSSLVAQFAAGLDIPPAFFLDSKLTGPNQRAVLSKAQKKFDKRQEVFCLMVEWVWVRVIGWAIERRELPAIEGWSSVSFQKPAKNTIDAGREAMQDREDTASGLLTRQDHYGARGKDWQRETDQAFDEHAYIITKAQELASKSSIPVETILSRFGYDAAPAPAPMPIDQEDDAQEPEDDTEDPDKKDET
jgi:capsid protein